MENSADMRGFAALTAVTALVRVLVKKGMIELDDLTTELLVARSLSQATGREVEAGVISDLIQVLESEE
ncbi:MAG TPA: hypothetical protein VGA44_05925 [Steroidobacteraceae bacterium]